MSIGMNTLSFQLTSPAGTVDITTYVSQEEEAEITDAIEKAHEHAEFVAPDVTIKGRDRSSSTVRNILRTITSDGTGWYLTINKNGQTRFSGDVLPNTVAIDDKEGTFALTAVGYARRLARTDCAAIAGLKRNVTGWVLSIASTPVPPYNAILVVFKAGATNCDFGIRDQIQLLVNGAPAETFTVMGIEEGEVSGQWQLLCDKPSNTSYPQGQTQPVLVTSWLRNVSLNSLVTLLFTGSSLATPTISTGTLIGTGKLFASPLGTSSLAGTLRGICPSIDLGTPANSGKRIWASTTQGLYEQASPPSGAWSNVGSFTSFKARVLDPTRYNVNLDLRGNLFSRQSLTQPNESSHSVRRYIAYDYSATSSPFRRYVLRVTIDADLGPYSTGVLPFKVEILKETSTDKDVWTIASTLVVENSTTLTDLNDFERAFSIEVDPVTGVVYFVDFTVGGSPGTEGTFQISSYTNAGTLTRNITLTGWPAGVAKRGIFTYLPTGRLALWNLDSQLVNVGWEYTFTINSSTQLTLYSTSGQPGAAKGSNWGGIIPHTLRKNSGDNLYYVLSANVLSAKKQIEIWLNTYTDDTFVYDPSYPATRLWTIYDVVITNNQVQQPPPLDLMVWKDPAVSSGRFPMIVQIGDIAQYVSDSYSGNIDYADFEGLNAADALSHLAVLANAYYYADAFGATFFRSRTVTAGSIAGSLSDNLENSRLVSVRYQPVSATNVRYVRVENETDDAIFGEAGALQFRTSDAYALVVPCRFVPTNAYAEALATTILNYLGANKVYVDLEHLDDWGDRIYKIGKTFRVTMIDPSTLDPLIRTFQMVAITTPPFGKTLKLQGLEL